MEKATYLDKLIIVAVLVGLMAVSGSCRRSGAPAGALKKEAGEKVSQIVFIGKQDACDCTKRRVKETWEAMQFAAMAHSVVDNRLMPQWFQIAGGKHLDPIAVVRIGRETVLCHGLERLVETSHWRHKHEAADLLDRL